MGPGVEDADWLSSGLYQGLFGVGPDFHEMRQAGIEFDYGSPNNGIVEDFSCSVESNSSHIGYIQSKKYELIITPIRPVMYLNGHVMAPEYLPQCCPLQDHRTCPFGKDVDPETGLPIPSCCFGNPLSDGTCSLNGNDHVTFGTDKFANAYNIRQHGIRLPKYLEKKK